jgi:hypothetical protein
MEARPARAACVAGDLPGHPHCRSKVGTTDRQHDLPPYREHARTLRAQHAANANSALPRSLAFRALKRAEPCNERRPRVTPARGKRYQAKP